MNKKPGMTLARGRVLNYVENNIRFPWMGGIGDVPTMLYGFAWEEIIDGMV
jgi:hypothetical protein